ncbi:hypothetical protein ML462_11905 [Gramella lutea]|uniref:Uncharacterized protein n=1 Tax=Christiangramia lutea TaxID=1607951 RepID=A0A9X1V4D0_9FLAO|nr:hypothetical protein [Christiangramia lutea]MCH4823876.1 hypothetical protein [Christiangramia lutea]
MNTLITHTSRLLLLLLTAGPMLRTAHFVLDDHANIYELSELKFGKKSLPHWDDHFIHAEYKGLVPGFDSNNLFRNIPERKKKNFDVRISQVTSPNLIFYVRGPPRRPFQSEI